MACFPINSEMHLVSSLGIRNFSFFTVSCSMTLSLPLNCETSRFASVARWTVQSFNDKSYSSEIMLVSAPSPTQLGQMNISGVVNDGGENRRIKAKVRLYLWLWMCTARSKFVEPRPHSKPNQLKKLKAASSFLRGSTWYLQIKVHTIYEKFNNSAGNLTILSSKFCGSELFRDKSSSLAKTYNPQETPKVKFARNYFPLKSEASLSNIPLRPPASFTFHHLHKPLCAWHICPLLTPILLIFSRRFNIDGGQ